MPKLLLSFVVFVATSCASTQKIAPSAPTASDADRAAVIAAVESLFAAMRTRDTTALRALLVPGTQLVAVRSAVGAPARAQVQPVSAFISSVGSATEELVERMWDPRVEVAGDIAALWAPYDFRIGARFSHCGHDAVQLVRTPTGWKISAITYTVITTGCSSP